MYHNTVVHYQTLQNVSSYIVVYFDQPLGAAHCSPDQNLLFRVFSLFLKDFDAKIMKN